MSGHNLFDGRLEARPSPNAEPPLVFGIVYAALAVAVFLAVPYALWATLILTLAGIAGLTAAFQRIAHEKSIERVIWVLDVAVIVVAAYLISAQ